MRRIGSTLVLIVCVLACAVMPVAGDPIGGWPDATIISSNVGNTIFNGININSFVGADRFYAHGYWGQRAIIANVEAGHIWAGHETLAHVNTFVQLADLNGQRQYDWHATMVGHVLGGRGWGYGWIINDQFNLSTWFGMAPGAKLWSGSISTGWIAEPPWDYTGSFNITGQSMMHVLTTVMSTGIDGQWADVINCSWGFEDPAGREWETLAVDAMALANRKTVVLAAGNHSAGAAQVGGPASGYNGIAVAALASDTSTPAYATVASFSNTGPNDYFNPQSLATVPAVRPAVDLAAPGDNLTLAFYGGLTGGHVSGTDPTAGNGQYYVADMGGTSFAAPIVAGGAALLVDVARDRFNTEQSVDPLVIKAVLLNSADKLAGWTNNAFIHDGVFTTAQALDFATGAGAMNLNRAFDQFTVGTTDLPGLAGGTVQRIGWDYAMAAADSPVDYVFAAPLRAGNVMTATLTWFVNRLIDGDTLQAADVQFSDLNLELWRQGEDHWELIARSISQYSTVEHIWLELPTDGFYKLRVIWIGENYDQLGLADQELFGIAWNVVPEPGTMVLLMTGLAVLAWPPYRAAMASR